MKTANKNIHNSYNIRDIILFTILFIIGAYLSSYKISRTIYYYNPKEEGLTGIPYYYMKISPGIYIKTLSRRIYDNNYFFSPKKLCYSIYLNIFKTDLYHRTVINSLCKFTVVTLPRPPDAESCKIENGEKEHREKLNLRISSVSKPKLSNQYYINQLNLKINNTNGGFL